MDIAYEDIKKLQKKYEEKLFYLDKLSKTKTYKEREMKTGFSLLKTEIQLLEDIIRDLKDLLC
jgi:hypothetical protein